LPPHRPDYHPALIAAFGLPHEIEPDILKLDEHAVQGVHLTLLRPDGTAKAGTDLDKLTLGPSMSWPIVIALPNDLLGLAITEGIEDALSVHQATGLGVWAAGTANRMPALANKIPIHIECVTIYAHPERAGQDNAYKLADALLARDIEVFIEGGLR
jgi:hypothetical protein